MKFASLLIVALTPLVAQCQETDAQKLARIDANQAAMLSTMGKVVDQQVSQAKQIMAMTEKLSDMASAQTAQKGLLDNIQADLTDLRVQVKALSSASGVKFVSSAPAWDGTQTVSTQPTAGWQSSSSIMTGNAWQSATSSTCANGSCGGSSGRPGLFGRRR